MESQPQNPEFKIHPENFHPCKKHAKLPSMQRVKQIGVLKRLYDFDRKIQGCPGTHKEALISSWLIHN